MKCENKKQAARVAFFGARKMQAAGYTVEPSRWPGLFDVRRPDGGAYSVRLAGQTRLGQEVKADCTCPFFKENAEFGECKHLTYTAWYVKAKEERDAEEDAFADDAEARRSLREA